VLGPRLGNELPAVRAALEAGEFDELPDGRVRAAGHELEPDELLVERARERGWAHSDRFSVLLDLDLDAGLAREGRVLDLTHAVNVLRKERGLDVTDRIVLTIPSADEDLLGEHADRIKGETLAVELRAGESLELEKA
jgi:isoleucyl-tRNA synthetase